MFSFSSFKKYFLQLQFIDCLIRYWLLIPFMTCEDLSYRKTKIICFLFLRRLKGFFADTIL